jgi:O-antigen ligase
MDPFATPTHVPPEASDHGRGRLRPLHAALAAAGLIGLAITLGDQLMAAAILGGLIVFVVVTTPVIGVVALLGTTQLDLPTFLAGSGRLTANNFLGLILLTMLIMQLCIKRDFWFVRRPQTIVSLLIGAAFLTSLVHSWFTYVPPPSLTKDFTESTLFPLFSRTAFLLLLVNFVKSQQHITWILFGFLMFTLAVLPSAFYNLATKASELEVDPTTGKTVNIVTGKADEARVSSKVSSWGQNENRLAFMCNIAILLLWMFVNIWKARIIRIAAIPVMLFLVVLVLATASRSGIISLGMVILFLLLQKGIPLSFRFGVVLAIVVCGLSFFAIFPQKTFERLLNYSLDQSERAEGWRSTLSRIETNQHAIEIFKSAPFLGIGPGNFRWLHRQLYPYTLAGGRPNHNSYLWAATEGGGLALCLYLLLFFFIWRDLQAAHRRSSQDRLWHMSRFLMGYLLVFLFFSGFADFWLDPHLYLLAGLSMLVRRFATDEESARPVTDAMVTSPATA